MARAFTGRGSTDRRRSGSARCASWRPATRRGVTASSASARTSRASIFDAVHLPEEPLGVLAVLGLMRRRMIETMERLDNVESLARITLLSVPEWCGSAYTDLDRRIAALEESTKIAGTQNPERRSW
jgi:hypothetical protein